MTGGGYSPGLLRWFEPRLRGRSALGRPDADEGQGGAEDEKRVRLFAQELRGERVDAAADDRGEEQR